MRFSYLGAARVVCLKIGCYHCPVSANHNDHIWSLNVSCFFRFFSCQNRGIPPFADLQWYHIKWNISTHNHYKSLWGPFPEWFVYRCHIEIHRHLVKLQPSLDTWPATLAMSTTFLWSMIHVLRQIFNQTVKFIARICHGSNLEFKKITMKQPYTM